MSDDPGRRQRDARRHGAARRGARARRRGATRGSCCACPQNRPRAGLVVYDDSVFDAAQARVDLALEVRPRRGASGRSARSATPTRSPPRSTPSREYHPDEIIISTYPESRSGWLRRDLIERVRDATGLPGRRTSSTTSTPRACPSTSRSPSPTARRAATSCSRRSRPRPTPSPTGATRAVHRRRARRRAASGARRRSARARGSKLVLDRLHERGPDRRPGMIGDPDPYTAITNALQYFRVDDIVISTFAGDQVRLAARRPDRARPRRHRQAGRARRPRRRRAAHGLGAPHGSRVDRPRHEHHGPPPAHRSSRVEAPTLGMLLFIISEMMIFGAFFTAYFFIRVVNPDPWPAPGTDGPRGGRRASTPRSCCPPR